MKKLRDLFVNRCAIKSLHAKKIFGFAAAGTAIAAFGAQAQAQTIIQDTFASPANYNMADYGQPTVTPGDAPSVVDLGTQADWQHLAAYVGTNASEAGGAGYIRSASAVGIGLGSYSSTPVLQTSVTASFLVTNPSGEPLSASGYILAGFSNANLVTTEAVNGPYGSNGRAELTYTGLAITGNGSLQEYVGGTAVGSAVAWGGLSLPGTMPSLDAATLTYDLNTATGAITNVSFSISGYGTNAADYSQFATAPGGFTSADVTDNELGASGAYNDVYAGYGTNDTATYGEYTAYSLVGVVPEPSTYALLAGGLAALGAFQYRRRQQSGI
jgi:hypothetical protein